MDLASSTPLLSLLAPSDSDGITGRGMCGIVTPGEPRPLLEMGLCPLAVVAGECGDMPGLSRREGEPGAQAATLLHTTPDTMHSLLRTLAATPEGQSTTLPTAMSWL